MVRRLPPGGRGVGRCGVVAGGHDYPQPAPPAGPPEVKILFWARFEVAFYPV
ncbi:hypothetical protein [Nitrosomonas nitrosa]|uniref:hypothetical protein n=1 Tax=Nitrosomonas nitrosa TaxID=52442 RepID=UPI001958744C|nr:hypothetical protein [Nitrosomonas nitrosa]